MKKLEKLKNEYKEMIKSLSYTIDYYKKKKDKNEFEREEMYIKKAQRQCYFQFIKNLEDLLQARRKK